MVVSIYAPSDDRSGYGRDLDTGLRENCGELSFMNLYGPYSRLDRNGDVLYETVPKYGTMPVKCYLMVPKVSETCSPEREVGTYTHDSVYEQVQDLTLYCNKHYEKNYKNNMAKKGQLYGVKHRTFGMAPKNAVVEDTEGCLSTYVARWDCVRFLTQELGHDKNFFESHKEVAQGILAPPYSLQEHLALGYPAPPPSG